jgi:non-homologous end joining protein Ku
MVALGRIVFTSREHVMALEPRGKDLLGITLRYPYEIRKEEQYFADVEDEKIPKDMLSSQPTSSRRNPDTSARKNSKTIMKKH